MGHTFPRGGLLSVFREKQRNSAWSRRWSLTHCSLSRGACSRGVYCIHLHGIAGLHSCGTQVVCACVPDHGLSHGVIGGGSVENMRLNLGGVVSYVTV